MKVIVINPPNKPFTNSSILAEPLDVLQVATIINENHKDVRVIDMDVNRMENNIDEYLDDLDVVVFVYDYQLPLHTSATVDNMFEIIKNTNKDVKFIIIGKSSSYYYEKFLNNGFDVVIKGIADNTINKVIENINDYDSLNNIPNIAYKNNDEIIVTKHESLDNNFDKLPTIKRDFLDFSKYMDTRTIITSRGCIGTCKYCTTPFFFKRWSARNAKDVVDEIEMIINTYGTKKILFLDDNATVDKDRMFNICKTIKERQIKCLFGLLSSISCYDKSLFEEMYNVGFRWVHFGIESGSEKVLKLMNKDMDFEYIKKVINEVKEIGYRVRTSFILDYPGSTKEDIIKTRNLIMDLKPHELRLHYLAYRVGTPVFNENINVSNKSQYIHSNKPNIENNELTLEINNLLNELKNNNYNLITEECDWNKYNNGDKETLIASFTPIKYGMCWYE